MMGGYRFKEQIFGMYGVSAALVTLTAVTVLTLILPNYTTSATGPEYTDVQLIFVAIVSLVLYGTIVMVQTVRHRDYFLPPEAVLDEAVHAPPPTNLTAFMSLTLLLACLGAVVLLAKTLSPVIEHLVMEVGAPNSLVGIIVAFVILLPEGLAALRAARKNRVRAPHHNAARAEQRIGQQRNDGCIKPINTGHTGSFCIGNAHRHEHSGEH
jgi:Ca2+:H+ antiporter